MWIDDLNKSSMLYWYPKICDLGLNIPKTKIVVLEHQNHELIDVCDGDFTNIDCQWDEILKAASQIRFPVFMRTDEFSGKHNWVNTCYVPTTGDLKQHIHDIIEGSFTVDMMGLPVRALVFREYIQMKNIFTAFYGRMPVNPEIRFFIKGGDVLCWHWYWVPEAIHNPSVENWKELMDAEIKSLSGNELLWLTKDAQKVAKVFECDGAWSVDFCKAKDGKWYLIDMALASVSWHPESCSFQKYLSSEV